ncbi:hypothetical protein [Acidisphaera sp. L21]|uniref:hypothetical protein n=1 Tax=Acidisphaera sp. L21 TaxID=1641851 RepID=UPI00131D58FA|nr:hypothetical protein [Acidisphaera sp. L21]
MTSLWRLHIRPGGGNGNVAASVALCLDRSIIGMGWPVPDETVTQSDDLEWYKEAASRQYGSDMSWHSVWTFAERPEIGDLVWFRDTEGRFFLAEILEPWRYAYEDKAAIGADIVNFRKVRIIEVGVADAVPGKVIACFRPSKTFQPIRSPGMLAFSSKLAGLPSADTVFDVYEFMSDADLENVVFVYLQVIGWYVLPGTRTVTTAHYEFVLVHREKGERAIVQVKSGGTWIDASSYAGQETAFLFAASGNYGHVIPSNVVLITRKQLSDFMRGMPHLLPRAVLTWISVAGQPVD